MIYEHARSPKKEVPGNLIFAEGLVVSQTLTEIVAYPQFRDHLAGIEERLKRNPKDPTGLIGRGELRLDRGDLEGATDDLIRALKQELPRDVRARARATLHEVLTEFLLRDFSKAEKYLPEYEDVSKLDLEGVRNETEKQERQNEARQRHANFLCLVARGKQAQGKLVEALDKYLEFAALAGKEELIAALDEPAVRAARDVWAQGRIRAMIAAGTPEQRKPLEERITARWKEIQNGKAGKGAKGLADLRTFVEVFGSTCKAGKEARLLLAERLMETDPDLLLEAEQQLNLLRGPGEDPTVAARAIECMARLSIRKGLLRDAAHYSRLLCRDFAEVPVIHGKTGGDIFDELASDKRMLPFLHELERLGGASRKIGVSQQVGSFPYQNQLYHLGQFGEKSPFFQENQLVVRYQPHSLRMLDRASGKEKWSQALTQTMFQNLVWGNGQNMPKFPFLNLGHLVVLPLGHVVFGIDPIHRKLLWEKNLAGSVLAEAWAGPTPNQIAQLTVDPRDNSVLVLYADGWTQRLAAGGMIADGVLCLQLRDGLVGMDPLTGRTLWTRSDVSVRCRVFGHEQVLCIAEMDDQNKARSTRVLRACDGVSIKVPDFAALYEKRVGQAGRTLVLREPGPGEGTTLRLYDVAAGKDLWKGDFPAGSILLKPVGADLTGMLAPDGTVRVIDVARHQEVLKSKVDPQSFAGAKEIWLLADSQDYYLAANGPPDGGAIQSVLMPGTGLQAIPVNGEVCCFHGADGKLRWREKVASQMLVLEHFRELPILLFAVRRIQPRSNGWVCLARQRARHPEEQRQTAGRYGQDSERRQLPCSELCPRRQGGIGRHESEVRLSECRCGQVRRAAGPK